MNEAKAYVDAKSLMMRVGILCFGFSLAVASVAMLL